MKQPSNNHINLGNIRLPAALSRSLIQAAAVHSLPISDILDTLRYDFSVLTEHTTVELSTLFNLTDALVTAAPFNTSLPLVKIISYEQLDEVMTLMVTGKTMRNCLENITTLINAT